MAKGVYMIKNKQGRFENSFLCFMQKEQNMYFAVKNHPVLL